jgi:hypothetical protein
VALLRKILRLVATLLDRAVRVAHSPSRSVIDCINFFFKITQFFLTVVALRKNPEEELLKDFVAAAEEQN